MRSGIHEGPFVMLAVDLDQRRAERAQHLHAHRLVVDEGAGAAVGELHAPQDQFVAVRTSAASHRCRQALPRRMVLRDLEGGGDLALLGAVAHQRRLAARAKRQRKGIEQDRFAGAGLAGEHSKAAAEIDVQPVDQDDVADGQAGEHGDRVEDAEDRTKSGSYAIPVSAVCARRPPVGVSRGP